MACLHAADILLPAEGIDRKKWAVIACDQFTSQPDYWEQVKEYVGDAPSTLHMIYPEAYLGDDDEGTYTRRLAGIQMNMERYLADGILAEGVHGGYVLTVRETEAGIRCGLIAALDLEAYEYAGDCAGMVRATEETVRERIPVRVGIRKNALVESPHVMMLLDDAACRVLEPLYHKKETFRRLYETELMLGGGKVSGYAVEGTEAEALTAGLAGLERESPEIFLAVGDGNHSLAAAKTCWEDLKKSLTEQEREEHPARYALVEVVNLHSPSLEFEAIHRVLYGGSLEAVTEGFRKYLTGLGDCVMEEWNEEETADIVLIYGTRRTGLRILNTKGRLAVDLLQGFLDEYLKENPEMKLDYVHSGDAVNELSKDGAACGMLLRAIDKSSLFHAVYAGGVLPRKTFSIGTESQKRYYMECRNLKVIGV